MIELKAREAEVIKLAETMIEGFEENMDIYPQPPFSPGEIRAALDAFKRAGEDRSGALDRIDYVTQKNLHYAQYIVDFDDEKLRLIGWERRKRRVHGMKHEAE